jgi:hypothetical protein
MQFNCVINNNRDEVVKRVFAGSIMLDWKSGRKLGLCMGKARINDKPGCTRGTYYYSMLIFRSNCSIRILHVTRHACLMHLRLWPLYRIKVQYDKSR